MSYMIPQISGQDYENVEIGDDYDIEGDDDIEGDEYDDIGANYLVGDEFVGADISDLLIGALGSPRGRRGSRGGRSQGNRGSRGGGAGPQGLHPQHVALLRAHRARQNAMAGMSAQKQAMTRALVAKKVMEGSLVRTSAPTKVREYPLPFDSVVPILAGATFTLPSNPQVLFRPDRLTVPSFLAPAFVLSDIKVGKDSQQVAAGNISCVVFAENAVGMKMKLGTAKPGMTITLIGQNISLAPARFLATMIGDAVE